MKARIRIWVYWRDSYARITLTEGEPVILCTGGPTDEGYSYSSETFLYNKQEETLERVVQHWSLDCDGRHEYTGEYVCPVEECCDEPMRRIDEKTQHVIETGDMGPYWTPVDQYVRDHSAEAMGY